jgi:predicted small lipoprotein YifL
MHLPTRSLTSRLLASTLALALSLSTMAACGKETPPPPVDDTLQGSARAPAEQTGMSTQKKVVLLAGAAALYYLYKKHQDAPAKDGPEGQYYLSKNGRVYYRDAEHRAHWVTPPKDGIEVPAAQAAEFSEFQGYDNRPTGRDLSGLAADPE